MSASTGDKQKYQTPNPYEAQFGYSRGVRKGPFIFISGTTSIALPSSSPTSNPTEDTPTSKPIEDTPILHPTSAYDQSIHIFTQIIRAVEALGGTKDDITRVRMFVTHDADTGEVGRAMKDCLGEVGPAATMIVGARFVRNEMRVEIEADAVVF